MRTWSLTDGKLLQTIRMPAGPGNIEKIYAVSVSPDGILIAAGGWTSSTTDMPEEFIYLFEAVTGKMMARIKGLSDRALALAFSPDGRYLAAGFYRDGLRVFDRDSTWSEVFRDTDYGDQIYGLAFAADNRSATASYDGNVRLYDRDFKLVVPPTETPGGHRLFRIAFSPDGETLAVGDEEAPEVYLLDGHSLAQLPGPDVDGLEILPGILSKVAWSSDGKTLYAAGSVNVGRLDFVVVSWGDAGRGERRHTLPGARNSISGLAALPDGRLLVAADSFMLLERDDRTSRWRHPPPKADFRGQVKSGGFGRWHDCRFRL